LTRWLVRTLTSRTEKSLGVLTVPLDARVRVLMLDALVVGRF
jgi:hypothetical protein